MYIQYSPWFKMAAIDQASENKEERSNSLMVPLSSDVIDVLLKVERNILLEETQHTI